MSYARRAKVGSAVNCIPLNIAEWYRRSTEGIGLSHPPVLKNT
jgi:hypothetical protein